MEEATCKNMITISLEIYEDKGLTIVDSEEF